MSIYKELSYDQDIEVVKGIQFSVLSPQEIVQRSVVEVVKQDTYTGNEPVIGGLFDPRMGVLEHNKYCSTCQQKNIFCPGHFGHISLARPVFHPMFFDTVRKLLKCVCYRCSRPMVSLRSNKEEFKADIKKISSMKSSKKRFDAIVKLASSTKLKSCGDDQTGEENSGCHSKQPTRYTKESSMKIVAEWKTPESNTQLELTAEDILRIFKRISDADIELMGFNPRWNKPEWMICSVLPVPPPAVRPSIIEENGQRREDDLTHKLSDIVKYNIQLKQRIDTNKGTEEQLKVLTNLIQYHIATFMDNTIPGLPVAQQRNGRKLKSISDRLKKKEGRIRGNLNGKRVDQSARSVITPDPFISLDELGVPIRIAMNLTFPETVNQYNIDAIRTLVRNGPNAWPGAKYIRKQSEGITVTLKYADCAKAAEELKVNDIVDRHLRDGDYVLFNRQPSLHKMSMMCHRVKVMPFQTFRLNIACTPSYNADFDGDEMNTFCSQNVQTMSELMDLAAVPYHILAPRDGKPMVEIVQDTMVGSFRLTKDWTIIHDKTMANLQMHNSYFSGSLPAPANSSTHHYSGKQAYSQILPPGLFVELKNRAEEKFKIVNSEIISGTIDKNVFHSLSTGIMPIIYHDYSPFEVRRFIDNTQRLICSWLMSAGFSVGISDLVTDKETEIKLKSTISSYKGQAYSILEEVRKGDLKNASIFSNEDNFERKILGVLNDLTKEVGSIGLKQIKEQTNRMINMIKSGSKGKETNVAQMIACVGQQNVDGKRVAYGFTDRTLPHYNKYDDGPEARGFVENSFISGLSPQEVFFHAMGGREGLIDTAVKTSETGYIQRRLVKAMEDCKVYYDQTVRNATGAVVQYLYGEDGVEGTKVENQRISYIDMNIVEIEAVHHLRKEDPVELFMTKEAIDSMNTSTHASGKHIYERLRTHYESIVEDRIYLITKIFKNEKQSKISYPIPFDRIIKTSMERLKLCGPIVTQTDLTPNHVLDNIERLQNKLQILRKGQGTRFLHILLHYFLSPKPLIFDLHMNTQVFDWVCTEIERFFINAIAQAGEMVGIVAAQSIGELGTQATLDSFHSSGTAAAVQATSGVPRLKELLSVSKNIKTPTLLIYMKPDISQVVEPIEAEDGDEDEKKQDPRIQETKERSMKIKQILEITRLCDILDGTEIYWDPPGTNGLHTNIQNDAGIMDIYSAFSQASTTEQSTSPWVLRLKLNKEKLRYIGLTMIDVYLRIYNSYSQNIQCVFSDDNAPELIFRIRMTKDAVKDISQDDAISALKAMEHNIVNNIILKGVKGIKKVSMRAKKRNVYNIEKDVFENISEWVLDTDGTNLQKILANPNVDAIRTYSNDIYEIYEILGIEAARNALYREFMEVVGEGSINYRHMSLLLDTMTNRGNLMSVDRHGINRGDVGPLAKSSFEETTDMLINASVFSEYDHINGVSANIMLGQLPPCGTGDHEIMLDEDHYIQLMKKYGKNHKNNMPPIFEDTEGSSEVFAEGCTIESLAFNYEMPEKRAHKELPTHAVTFV